MQPAESHAYVGARAATPWPYQASWHCGHSARHMGMHMSVHGPVCPRAGATVPEEESSPGARRRARTGLPWRRARSRRAFLSWRRAGTVPARRRSGTVTTGPGRLRRRPASKPSTPSVRPAAGTTLRRHDFDTVLPEPRRSAPALPATLIVQVAGSPAANKGSPVPRWSSALEDASALSICTDT